MYYVLTGQVQFLLYNILCWTVDSEWTFPSLKNGEKWGLGPVMSDAQFFLCPQESRVIKFQDFCQNNNNQKKIKKHKGH